MGMHTESHKLHYDPPVSGETTLLLTWKLIRNKTKTLVLKFSWNKYETVYFIKGLVLHIKWSVEKGKADNIWESFECKAIQLTKHTISVAQ